MDPIQVVIDTNVMVASFRSRRGASFALLQRLRDPGWRTNISATLILEYEMALKRDAVARGIPLWVAETILDTMVMAGNRRCIFFRWRPFLPDPKDDFVLELAVASGAPFIITYNCRDFEGAETFGIQAIRPSEFLRMLGVSYP